MITLQQNQGFQSVIRNTGQIPIFNTIIYQPNDKNNKTLFEIQIDRSQEWSELETYEKPYIVSSRPYIIRDLNNSNIYPGQLTELLAKQNDQVYHIESFCFLLPTSNDTIHFTLVSPDNYSIDYFSDFKEVLNSISVNEKLIKVSFSLKELQGKRIDDVREQLKQAGFLSINEIPTSAVFRSQKEGTVAKVVVDRDKSLEDSDIYSIDSVVTITYYSK